MNLFVTSNCPEKCAEYIDDKRVVKMVLETAQLLSTAARICGSDDNRIYKATHVNHPCSMWVRETKQNYLWTLRHFSALCYEYTKRYGKIHKSSALYPYLKDLAESIPEGEMTEFTNCAANESLGISFKHISNVFLAYKLYLDARWKLDARTPTWKGKAA